MGHLEKFGMLLPINVVGSVKEGAVLKLKLRSQNGDTITFDQIKVLEMVPFSKLTWKGVITYPARSSYSHTFTIETLPDGSISFQQEVILKPKVYRSRKLQNHMSLYNTIFQALSHLNQAIKNEIEIEHSLLHKHMASV